jgi:hypothetical protein
VSWSPKAPEIVDALVQRFTAALATAAADGSAVAVWDGPQATQAPLELVTVGWTGMEGQLDIDEQIVAESLTGNRTLVTVTCAAAVIKGATDMSAARVRASALVAATGASLAGDPKLGGTVMRARVASVTTVQDQTKNGAQATAVFTVECDAFTNR